MSPTNAYSAGEAAIVEWLFKKRQRRSDPMPRNAMRVLSFLTPAQCGSLGLPGVAVQGTFTDEECSAGGFRPNPVFIEFMHEVIRTAGPTDADMQDAAAGQETDRYMSSTYGRPTDRRDKFRWRTLSAHLK
jgi:hypothetical protein